MFGSPQQTSLDVRFVLFQIPISITPFFWLIASLFGFMWMENRDGLDMVAFLAVVLAILLAILVHEMGHALVVRYVFGAMPVVVLHGLGGVTMYDRPYYYRTPQRWGRIFISFAGPLAGFLLSAVCLLVLYHFGAIMERGSYLVYFLSVVATIGIFWGIFNLLPIYPMDGGHIFREICLMVSPRNGMQASLIVSAGMAGLLTLLSLRFHQPFIAILFGVMAWQNIQALQSRRY